MCCLHAMWGPGGHTRPLLRVKVGQWPSDGTGAQNSSRVWHLVTSGQSCRVKETNREIKHIRISSGRIELFKRRETLSKNIELAFKSTNCPTKGTYRQYSKTMWKSRRPAIVTEEMQPIEADGRKIYIHLKFYTDHWMLWGIFSRNEMNILNEWMPASCALHWG